MIKKIISFFVIVLILVFPLSVIAASGDTTVYITESGECYHLYKCSYLRKSCISISLQDAVDEGYRPCSVCDPPRLSNQQTITKVTPKTSTTTTSKSVTNGHTTSSENDRIVGTAKATDKEKGVMYSIWVNIVALSLLFLLMESAAILIWKVKHRDKLFPSSIVFNAFLFCLGASALIYVYYWYFQPIVNQNKKDIFDIAKILALPLFLAGSFILSEDPYDKGYEDAERDSKENNVVRVEYEKGKKDGYKSGYDAGIAEGEKSGKKTGYETGYAKGYIDGVNAEKNKTFHRLQ